MTRKLLIAACILAVLGCLVFAFIVINSGITIQDPAQPVTSTGIDVREKERELIDQLRTAPWQGLRFLSDEREWRFYGVAREEREVNIIQTFRLIKVFYLQSDGDLAFTWVTLGVEIPGQGYVAVGDAEIQSGDLIAVSLKGEHVFQSGVVWDDCSSEYCRLAQRIDTILILDDEGTGITNGFIREGWQPPTYPMYGFLCWQVRLVDETDATAARLEGKP